MLTLEFEFWIVAGEKKKRKNNTTCNSTKGEQVRKVFMWHWRIVMSERNGWFMLHFKNFGSLKSPTVRQNCTELIGINNDEILFTLFSKFSSIDITLKKPIKIRLNSNNKSRFKDFILEWQFEQTKKKLYKIFIKTTRVLY